MTAVAAPSTGRERILLTAERLIGEQGVAVSLREVASAAGQRNTSAVHYHFGSRDALIEAIVDLREQSLERERMALLAAHEAAGRDGLRSLVESLYAPLFRTPYAEGSTHYARFLEKVRDHPSIVGRPLDETHWPAVRIIVARIMRSLRSLPPPIREQRLRAMMTAVFALLADAERAGLAGSRSRRARAFEQNVLDMVVGMLTAPVHQAVHQAAHQPARETAHQQNKEKP